MVEEAGTQKIDITANNEHNMEENLDQAQVTEFLGSIMLTEIDKQRIYRPWIYSVIIKIQGKKLSHQYLKAKLRVLWNVSEKIILIDLGHDYHTVKFLKKKV